MAAYPLPIWFIGTGDLYLHAQMLIYYLVALLLGAALGYLVWGWGRTDKIELARAEGMRAAERRADAEGRSGEVGRLKAELDIATKARASLEARLEQVQSELEATPRMIEPEPEAVEPIPEAAEEEPEAVAEAQEPETEEPPFKDSDLSAMIDPGSLAPDQPEPFFEPHAIEDEIDEDGPPSIEVTEEADAAPADPDDLTLIKGIGPKLAERLNGMGVFRFAQIAEWDTEDIASVDERLAFRGRIERDDWVGQARRLTREDI
ncbi:MAG: helix-hairpin-helix domain-containing protein [Pseudomonadota bacterium]